MNDLLQQPCARILTVLLAAALPASPAMAQQPQGDPYTVAVQNLQAQDPMIRRQAADELGRMHRAEATAALLPVLSDENPYVRSAVVDALGTLRAPQAKEQFHRLLREDPHEQVRQQAAVSLTYVGDASSVDILIAALDDKESGVRFAVIRTIGNLGARKVGPKLVPFLKDPDSAMRRTAAGTLGKIATPEVLPALKEALQDADALVRREVVKAIGAVETPEAVQILVSCLADTDASVRAQAVVGLAWQHDASGEKAAIELLKHEDVTVRLMAANALSMAGSKEKGLPALDAAAKVESQANAKQQMGFALATFKARLGLKEEPKPEPAKAPETKKPAAEPQQAPSKKPAAAPKKTAAPKKR